MGEGDHYRQRRIRGYKLSSNVTKYRITSPHCVQLCRGYMRPVKPLNPPKLSNPVPHPQDPWVLRIQSAGNHDITRQPLA